jgi:TonB family protein
MSRLPKKFPGYFFHPLPFDMPAESPYPWVMCHKSPMLWTVSLAAVSLLLPLQAQDSADVTLIRDAQTARNPASLEARAATLEGEYQYDAALKVMDAALALRAQVNGDHSADYGLSLLKAGALERRAGLYKEAGAHYTKAIEMLPGRPEAAPAFLYLGISDAVKKPLTLERLQRAQLLDASLSTAVLTWTAYAYEVHSLPEDAEAAYKSALGASTTDTMQTFETLTLYSRFLRQHGREAEADALKARTSAIRPPSPKPAQTAAPQTPIRAQEPTIVSPDSSGRVFAVGRGVTQPSVTYKKDPSYSEEARVAKYSASVLVQLVVDIDGTPKKIRVVKPAGFGLDECAVSTIAKWQFKPGQKDGTAVPVYANIEVNFRLL